MSETGALRRRPGWCQDESRSGRNALWRVQVPCRDVVYCVIFAGAFLRAGARLTNRGARLSRKCACQRQCCRSDLGARVLSRLRFPFLRQSHAAVFMGRFREKCDRKPETVVATLIVG